MFVQLLGGEESLHNSSTRHALLSHIVRQTTWAISLVYIYTEYQRHILNPISIFRLYILLSVLPMRKMLILDLEFLFIA